LLAGSATMPAALVMTIFIFLGVGMALPYLVLAIFPKMVERIPRTGPASDLVKQVMGLMMLAAAAYFLGTSVISFGADRGWVFPWWGKAVHWWAIGLVGVGTGLWLMARTFSITKRSGMRLTFAILGIFFAFSGSAIAYNQTTHLHENYVHNIWQAYTPESLESALSQGNVVVLDFTAEWCLNCKTLEAVVLNKEPVKPLLLSEGVVPMVADVTGNSAPGWEKIKELDQVGIPLLAVFSPGHSEPIWMSNAYSGSEVAMAIDDAKSRARIIRSDD
jgi:thiol:disulfide interchange protein